ncbi:MAG: choice-of-anchor Q domain-containing protein, partial [Planctomycetota bacterium]
VGEGAGGIYGSSNKFPQFTLENSILATNQGPAPDLQLSPGPMTIRYSLIGTNIGSGLIEAPIGSPDADGNLIGGPMYGAIDPRLGPLTDNGGLSFTHGLLPGSPAIDAGDRNAIAGTGNVPFYDQRGEPFGRVVDGDAFPDASIDMGSFELQMATIVVDTTIDEDDGDFSIGDLSLREAVDIAETKGGSVFFDTEGIFAAPQTITLSLGELVVASAISIFGPGPSHLTIDGNHQSRLFATDDSETISRDIRLSGMTLVNGQDTSGGAIFNRENLTLEDVVISSSTASVDGGGIDHATGMLKVIDSILSGNSAAELGGAILTAPDCWNSRVPQSRTTTRCVVVASRAGTTLMSPLTAV